MKSSLFLELLCSSQTCYFIRFSLAIFDVCSYGMLFAFIINSTAVLLKWLLYVYAIVEISSKVDFPFLMKNYPVALGDHTVLGIKLGFHLQSICIVQLSEPSPSP